MIAFVKELASSCRIVPGCGGSSGAVGDEGFHSTCVVVGVGAAVGLVTSDFFGAAIGEVFGGGHVGNATCVRLIDCGLATAVVVGIDSGSTCGGDGNCRICVEIEINGGGSSCAFISDYSGSTDGAYARDAPQRGLTIILRINK